MPNAKHAQAIADLNRILTATVDARERFRTAARNEKPGELKTFFNVSAQQRARFGAQLERLIRDLGGTPHSRETAAGRAHKGWIHLRTLFTGSEADELVARAEQGWISLWSRHAKTPSQTLLQECRRGDNRVVRRYEQVLQRGSVPHFVKDALADQLLGAANDDVDTYAVNQKEEKERVAAAAR